MLNELLLVVQLMGGKEDTTGLRIYTDRSLPVRLVFQNKSAGPVTLLATFDPPPIFFSFNIRAADGTPVSVPGAGKIAMDRMPMLSIAPGQQHVHALDLAAVLKRPLPAGNYSLSVQYHNQYGGPRAYTGYLDSQAVNFRVVAGDVYDRIPDDGYRRPP